MKGGLKMIKFIKFSAVERKCYLCGSGNVGESGDGLICWDCRTYQE